MLLLVFFAVDVEEVFGNDTPHNPLDAKLPNIHTACSTTLVSYGLMDSNETIIGMASMECLSNNFDVDVLSGLCGLQLLLLQCAAVLSRSPPSIRTLLISSSSSSSYLPSTASCSLVHLVKAVNALNDSICTSCAELLLLRLLLLDFCLGFFFVSANSSELLLLLS